MSSVETAVTPAPAEAVRADAAVVAQPVVAPRPRPRNGLVLACAGIDVSMLLFAAGATALGSRLAGSRTPSVGWMAAFTAVALVAYGSRGLYTQRLRLRLLDDVRRLLVGT